jgi:hypothetical protein
MAVIMTRLLDNQIGLQSVLQSCGYGKSPRDSKREGMMRELAEREIDRFGVKPGRPRARARSVTVNLAESPLGWLASRGLVAARQVEAGERLRRDYEMAALGPRVTMRWDAQPGGQRGLPAEPLDPTLAGVAAKRRFDAAVAAVGRGLADVLWRVVCAGEGLPAAERALGWPARSGRVVLGLALDRLGDHYGLK